MEQLLFEALALELATLLEGSRLQKVYQYGRHAVVLELYARERRHLLLAADPKTPRFHLVSGWPDQERARSPLVEALRAHAVGAVLRRLETAPGERVLELVLAREEVVMRLVLEAIPRAACLAALDPQGRILAAHGGHPERLAPGAVYAPPPRTRPALGELEPEAIASTLSAALASGRTLEKALGESFSGVSPIMARELAERAGGDPGSVAAAHAGLASELGAGQHVAAASWRGRRVLLPILPRSLPEVELLEGVSLNDAVAAHYAAGAEAEQLGEERDRLVKAVARRRARLESLEHELAAQLERAHGADGLRVQGEMLLAYQHGLNLASGTARVPHPSGEGEILVPVDPKLDAAANAGKIFERYRKLKRGQTSIAGRAAEVAREAERLAGLAAALEAAGAHELGPLAQELTELGVVKPRPAAGRRREPPGGPASLEPRRFVASDGSPILVGRSSRGNDRLTFALAKPHDFWLHADSAGAHVVLVNSKRRSAPDTRALGEAAALAAWFSKRRRDTKVEVHWTERSKLRRAPRGPAGRVLLSEHRSILAVPEAARERFQLEDA